MSYRPNIKTNTSGGLTDFPLDAETVKGVDVVITKQDLLVDSGVNQNIKTLNGNSILGSGDLTITAVATDEKARKLLGEFDVYPAIINGVADDKKVERHTRYRIIKGDTFNWSSDEPYSNFYGIYRQNALKDNVVPASDTEVPKIYATGWNVYSRSDILNHNQGITIQANGNYFMIRDTSTSSKEELIAKLNQNPILLQYEPTSNSYYDDVIPSGQILNLDSNGCQFVRDEWEKQLNLFTRANYVSDRAINVDKTFTTNSEIAFSNISGADPYAYMNFKGFEIGKQYTISYLSNQVLQGAFFGGGGNAIISYGTYGSYTFTAEATTYELGFEFDTTGYTTCNVKIMLNYDNVDYPYVENNGEIAHKGIDNNFSKEQTITSPTTDTPLRIKGNSNNVCDIMFIGANDAALSWLSAHNDGYLYDYRNNAYHRLAELEEVLELSTNGAGAIIYRNSDTPLNLKSNTSKSYIGFYNSSATPLGWIGVNASNEPIFDTSNSSYKIITSKDISSGEMTFNVIRNQDVDSNKSKYWSAMVHNTSPTGSWYHIISMDWDGNSVSDWISQLALPTQDGGVPYYRRNDTSGTAIGNSTWHKFITDENIYDYAMPKGDTPLSGNGTAYSNVSTSYIGGVDYGPRINAWEFLIRAEHRNGQGNGYGYILEMVSNMTDQNNDHMFWRKKCGGGWSNWYTLANEGDLPHLYRHYVSIRSSNEQSIAYFTIYSTDATPIGYQVMAGTYADEGLSGIYTDRYGQLSGIASIGTNANGDLRLAYQLSTNGNYGIYTVTNTWQFSDSVTEM